MRLISYRTPVGLRPGVLSGDDAYDLSDILSAVGAPVVPSIKILLEREGTRLAELSSRVADVLARGAVRPVGPRSGLHLAAPIPDPAKIICVGLNYATHVAETGRTLPEHPDLFAKFASTLIGADDEIRGAELTDNLDFEGELAVVIGAPAFRISEKEAPAVIAGYSLLNDVTARDLQYRGTQWLAGKAVDGTTPFGPALVTSDEVGDPQVLDIRTRLNGLEVQASNTQHMIFPVARVVSYISQIMALAPGDVIATGTPEGIGAKRTPPLWMASGDVLEIEIERLGTLRNVVR